MKLVPPLPFTKNCQVLKIRALKPSHNTYQHTLGDYLFDLRNDPDQKTAITDQELISELQGRMSALLKSSDAPDESFVRYGLTKG